MREQTQGNLLTKKNIHNLERITAISSFSEIPSSLQYIASPLQSYLSAIHEKYKSVKEGKVASYIPELAKADPDWFGISIVNTDGQIYRIGDYQQRFTIQSISKPFVYGLALEKYGRETVLKRVGLEPTGEAFNSIVFDEINNRPWNPMVNAGAIATTDLLTENDGVVGILQILEMFRHYTGRQMEVDIPVFLSEKATGNRNRAIAYLMKNSGMISDKIEETLDIYFQQCAISLTCNDLAIMGATLANKGINPITGEQAIQSRYVQDVLSLMHTCGMYDFAGEWAYRVGFPAKSGVSGGIVAVVPGKCGIGIFSPLLDAKGNSIRAIKVCEQLAQDFGLHLYNAVQPSYDLAFLMQ
ncbi:glutaminase A [Nostoc sp. FACHB-152]|uniref:glutaminase A n=1 Tax=unclassified Nostoc TaxID=2593658 RepID=UPI001681EF81|nr:MULTISPECIES: glutaminase A [unclassified Nostoc]MBD2451942.1 glutaminase A [Nostoc sp. FACHB-152]MBD2473034.1 glutaminase A [Nostoc sp. FACHB-145]